MDIVLDPATIIQSLEIALHLFEFDGFVLVVEVSKDVAHVAQIRATIEEVEHSPLAEQTLLRVMLARQ